MGAFLAAVVNGAVVGSALAVLVAVGLRLAPRRALNAATRYAVLWVTLAAVVTLPVAFLPRPGGRALEDDAVPAPVVQVARHRAAPIAVSAAIRPPGHRAPAPLFPLPLPAGRETPWVLLAWALASAWMLLRLIVSCLFLQREKRRAVPAPGTLVEQWLAQCGCSQRHARLAAAAGIATPMVAGWWRPAILIPARLLEQLDEGELHQIGLHEAAHLARRDDYALLLERVLEAVWVWHPAVRWIARQLDLEREIACDDFVVKVTGQARPYAACLTRVVELTGAVRGSLAAAAAAEENSHLTRRVNMLLDRSRNSAARLLKARFAVMLVVVAGLGVVAARLPGPVAFAMPQRPVAPAVPAAPPAPAAPAVAQAPSIPTPVPQTPQIRPAVEDMLVKVPVMVQDPLHRAVTGLAKESFRVFEDGVEQQVVEFASADTPTSFVIVFDGSGSTAARQEQARQAVAQFMRAAGAGSEFCLVEFHERATVASGFTSDAAQIQGRLDMIRARGGTSLWEAIVLALQEVNQGRNPAKAILLVTDGVDNTSSISAEQAKAAARAAGIPISAIGFGDDRRGNAFLDEIADATGGRHMSGRSRADAGAAAGIATRNGYVLTYRSKNTAHDGAYRTLRVEIVPPVGLPPLTVRSRTGYYAPRQ